MKFSKIFSIFLLCFAIGVYSIHGAEAKKPANKPANKNKIQDNSKSAKKNDIDNRLDTITFPAVNFKNVQLTDVIEYLNVRSSRFHPNSKSVRIKMVKGKRPDKGRASLAPLPNVTLNKKNVTLRQLLDEISKTTGYKYTVKKGHVEFERRYIGKDKNKDKKNKDKSKKSKSKGKNK